MNQKEKKSLKRSLAENKKKLITSQLNNRPTLINTSIQTVCKTNQHISSGAIININRLRIKLLLKIDTGIYLFREFPQLKTHPTVHCIDENYHLSD